MKKSISLLAAILMSVSAIFAQNIADSVKVYGFPVREGVIYKYEPKLVLGSLNTMPVINVMTPFDSLFHFEEGTVMAVRKFEDCYAVFLENERNEIIVYSNMKKVAVRKGELVSRGMYMGEIERGYDVDCNQIDMVIFRKGKEIPNKKAMEYIQNNISYAQKRQSYTL